jgi:hypothetical protein
MRSWSVVLVLLGGACGTSARPIDAAVTGSVDGPPASHSTGSEVGMPFVDMGGCDHWAGRQFPTDAAACVPVPEYRSVYDLRIGVDAGACEGRTTVACDEVCGAGPTLDSQVTTVLERCTQSESAFVVTFSQGCAERLHLETPYYRPDEIAACVQQALSSFRFACAERVPCWQWFNSTLASP